MITIKNNIFPFKGFLAMCVFPFLFVRKDARRLTVIQINHEKIHGRQQIETHIVALVLAFLMAAIGLISWWLALTFPLVYFAFYGLEWLVKLFVCGLDTNRAYKSISFEQEAYGMQTDLSYLKHRKPFQSWKYLFKITGKK